MTPKQYIKKHGWPKVEKVVKEAGTTVNNFRAITWSGGSVSSRLAKRLEEASGGEMTVLDILFPEDSPRSRRDKA